MIFFENDIKFEEEERKKTSSELNIRTFQTKPPLILNPKNHKNNEHN